MNNCQRERCKNYSDVDVYFADGTSESVCAKHSFDRDIGDNRVVQFVPQHGGDCNQLQEKYAMNGKIIHANFSCKVKGPCYDHKGKLLGYHVDIRMGLHQPITHTVVRLDQIVSVD